MKLFHFGGILLLIVLFALLVPAEGRHHRHRRQVDDSSSSSSSEEDDHHEHTGNCTCLESLKNKTTTAGYTTEEPITTILPIEFTSTVQPGNKTTSKQPVTTTPVHVDVTLTSSKPQTTPNAPIEHPSSTALPPTCPPHSEPTLCVSKCMDSCRSFVNAYPTSSNDPGAPHVCIEDEDCTPGCQCENGYLAEYVDGKLRCVLPEDCGCRDNEGNYHNKNDSWPGPGCNETITCFATNKTISEPSTCEGDCIKTDDGNYQCVIPTPTPNGSTTSKHTEHPHTTTKQPVEGTTPGHHVTGETTKTSVEVSTSKQPVEGTTPGHHVTGETSKTPVEISTTTKSINKHTTTHSETIEETTTAAPVPPTCPPHSEPTLCVSKCMDSCRSFVNAYPTSSNDPGAPHVCIEDEDCTPGCQCENGYLAEYVDGKLRCVLPEDCGCRDNEGNYHNKNDSWPGPGCNETITCFATNKTISEPSTCEGDCIKTDDGNYQCVIPTPAPNGSTTSKHTEHPHTTTKQPVEGTTPGHHVTGETTKTPVEVSTSKQPVEGTTPGHHVTGETTKTPVEVSTSKQPVEGTTPGHHVTDETTKTNVEVSTSKQPVEGTTPGHHVTGETTKTPVEVSTSKQPVEGTTPGHHVTGETTKTPVEVSTSKQPVEGTTPGHHVTGETTKTPVEVSTTDKPIDVYTPSSAQTETTHSEHNYSTTTRSPNNQTQPPIGNCPLNSHYSTCASPCAEKCFTLNQGEHLALAPPRRPECNKCLEACECDEGYVIDATQTTFVCVLKEECVCIDENGFAHEHNTTWLNKNCSQKYTCINGTTITEPMECKPYEKCKNVNRQPQCVPVGTVPTTLHPTAVPTQPSTEPSGNTNTPDYTTTKRYHDPHNNYTEGPSTTQKSPSQKTTTRSETIEKTTTAAPVPPTCPPHSEPTLCVSKCMDSCRSFVNAYPTSSNDPGAPHVCIEDEDCTPGCQCENGYLAEYVDGKLRCVLPEDCGCRDNEGNYHNKNDSWPGPGCNETITCFATNKTISEPSTCEGDCIKTDDGNYQCVIPTPTPNGSTTSKHTEHPHTTTKQPVEGTTPGHHVTGETTKTPVEVSTSKQPVEGTTPGHHVTGETSKTPVEISTTTKSINKHTTTHSETIEETTTAAPVPPTCPPHSEPTLCVSKCMDSCRSFVNAYPTSSNDPGAPHVCIEDEDCTPGCQCENGYLAEYVDGKLRCVLPEDCGCRDNEGNYHNKNDSWPGPGCNETITCFATNKTISEPSTCEGDCIKTDDGNYQCVIPTPTPNGSTTSKHTEHPHTTTKQPVEGTTPGHHVTGETTKTPVEVSTSKQPVEGTTPGHHVTGETTKTPVEVSTSKQPVEGTTPGHHVTGETSKTPVEISTTTKSINKHTTTHSETIEETTTAAPAPPTCPPHSEPTLCVSKCMDSCRSFVNAYPTSSNDPGAPHVCIEDEDCTPGCQCENGYLAEYVDGKLRCVLPEDCGCRDNEGNYHNKNDSWPGPGCNETITCFATNKTISEPSTCEGDCIKTDDDNYQCVIPTPAPNGSTTSKHTEHPHTTTKQPVEGTTPGHHVTGETTKTPVEVSTSKQPVEGTTPGHHVTGETTKTPVEVSTSKQPVEGTTPGHHVTGETTKMPVEVSTSKQPVEGTTPGHHVTGETTKTPVEVSTSKQPVEGTTPGHHVTGETTKTPVEVSTSKQPVEGTTPGHHVTGETTKTPVEVSTSKQPVEGTTPGHHVTGETTKTPVEVSTSKQPVEGTTPGHHVTGETTTTAFGDSTDITHTGTRVTLSTFVPGGSTTTSSGLVECVQQCYIHYG